MTLPFDTQAVTTTVDLPPEIARLEPHFGDLERQLATVYVHIGRMRGTTALNAEDLGIELTEGEKSSTADNGLFSLGSKRWLPLVPKTSAFYNDKKPKMDYARLLQNLENAPRTYLDSVAWTIGMGERRSQVVHLTRVEEVNKKLEEYRAAYETARDELCASAAVWDAAVTALHLEYEREAQESWRRYMAQNAKHPERQMGLEEFKVRQWKAVLDILPTAAQFYDSFYFQVTWRTLDFTPWVNEAAKERYFEEWARDPRMNTSRVFRACFDKYHEIFDAQIQEKATLRGQILSDLVTARAGAALSMAREILAGIEKADGTVTGAATRQFNALYKQLSQVLDGDDDSTAMAARLRELLAEWNTVTSGDLKRVLTDIATVSASVLSQLGTSYRDSRGRPVEVSAPAPETVRVARSNLGCELAPVAETARATRIG